MLVRRRAQQTFFAAFLLFAALWPLTNYVDAWPEPKFVVWAMYSRGLGERNRDPALKLYFPDGKIQALPAVRHRPLVTVLTADRQPYFRYFVSTRAPRFLAAKLCADHPMAESVGLNLADHQEERFPCVR